MEIDLTTFHAIGSLLLGILAWLSACAAIKSKKSERPYQLSAGSFALCVFSLLLQLLEVKYLVGTGNFSAIEDTINAVVMAAWVLVGITIVLNAIAVVHAIKEGET